MRFRSFSPKQKQVLTWWCDPAVRGRDALICDGAVRSGYMEYECDINAVTGVIIDWDADWDD